MHPRLPPQVTRVPPPQVTRDHAVPRVDDEAGLGAELAAVVAGARRRAVRDGDRQIDTAHLLHSLLESGPDVRAAFEPPQVARLLGYLVQRSIGYGLRWQTAVEDSGALPAAGRAEGYSPLAALAVRGVLERALRHGRPPRGVDLLAALVADPEARAVQVLGHAGIDARELSARLAREPSGDAGSSSG
ncbi:peptidase [Streptomyces sp. Ru71]|uniref:Clp protease N-terminal domain-containing protein n=1 Tax=Streptomyces sp. Ru71 TaxID=2080746 RepID=UPI000CDDD7CB|nr:Clp protease N-terminal domain-containing protein [Streptomyces sp. Ru71]POX44539.1 peptidase [Streptomyces sp. Ru71]